jgi:predicted Zn-dependent peptidase
MRTLARSGLPTVAVLLTAAGLAGPVDAQDYTHPREMDLPASEFERPDPDDIRLTLDNGLVAYVAEDHRAPLVTFTAFVAGGTADREPGEASVVGAALRRGPASMSRGDFRAALDEMAADYSVSVSHEEIEVTLDVPAEDAWAALQLFAATLREPAFETGDAPAGGRTTRAEGIDWDSSIAGAIDAFQAHLFDGHPYGRVPSAEELGAARRGGAQSFHGRYFVPANTVLAIAGDFDVAAARRQTEAAFASWPAGGRPDLAEHPAVRTSTPRQVLQANAEKLQGWVVIGHELPMVPADERAALDVMNYILGAYHLDARLFRAARELRGLTNDNSAFLEPSVRGPGTYSFHTYGRPEAVRLLVDVTFRELERIRDEPASDQELFVAQGALTDGTWASAYATGQDATRTYAREWLHHGDHDQSERYVDEVRAVTIQDVQAMARKYLHPDRMIVAVVGPLDEIADAPGIEDEPQLESWGRVERIDRGSGGQ